MILKKICTICTENRDFIGFSKLTGSKLNIQNGSLHWFNSCQNFDFQIALTFLSDFDQVYGRLHGLIRACMSDSHTSKVAVPFKVAASSKQLTKSDMRTRMMFF